MHIKLSKFGLVLTSRSSGKEAYAAFLPTLAARNGKEDIVIDFDGVVTFSPSWGDEFLTPLQNKYGNSLRLRNIENPSVSLTIETLEKISGVRFAIDRSKNIM